jgi:hypothetical protein
MSRWSTRVTFAALISGLLLAAAGCGGGEKSAETTTPATTAPASTEATPTTTEVTPTETTPTETTPTETTSTETTSTPTTAINSEKCRELTDAIQNISSSLTGGDAADIERTAKLFDELAKTGPEEIRADFAVLADAYHKIAKIAGKGKNITPEEAQKLASELDTAKITQAAQNISTWLQKNCTSG